MKTIDKYFQSFQRASENYERNHPHWRIEVLVSLIKWGLTSLKHYIEDARDSEISWDAPFVAFTPVAPPQPAPEWTDDQKLDRLWDAHPELH